ncbi:MAG TPA: tail fiber domain-containing protein [Longimicrobiaceae bacterium]|nr:tail fiber domain-containing protein [Longimicrobiaceae bacterium]
MTTRIPGSFLLLGAALLAGAASSARAQSPTDSVLAVSYGGNSLFRVNVNGGLIARGTYDSGASGGIASNGAGTRMLWYPGKAAFRAGGINGTQWDDANVGLYTAAFGEDVRASGDNGFAVGQRATAAGSRTVAMGEDVTATGANSVALGQKASTSTSAGAPRNGTFVFGDRSTTIDTIHAEVTNSATWRVANGFRIYTSSNRSTGVTFQSGAAQSNWGQDNAVISTSTGAYLHTNGTWTNASDVNRKHRFASVSGEEVLARLRTLPITTWTYRSESDEVRHLGPMAQDFRAAFGLGDDERVISTVDADGVALAAAKALERRTAEQAEEIRALRAESAASAARISELEARLARLEELLGRGETAGGRAPRERD